MGGRACTEHAPRPLGEKAPEDRQDTAGTGDRAQVPCPRPQEKRIAGIRLWAALSTHDSIWLLVLVSTPLMRPKQRRRTTAIVKSSNITHETGDTNSSLMFRTD